jgi:hypothetical protein
MADLQAKFQNFEYCLKELSTLASFVDLGPAELRDVALAICTGSASFINIERKLYKKRFGSDVDPEAEFRVKLHYKVAPQQFADYCLSILSKWSPRCPSLGLTFHLLIEERMDRFDLDLIDGRLTSKNFFDLFEICRTYHSRSGGYEGYEYIAVAIAQIMVALPQKSFLLLKDPDCYSKELMRFRVEIERVFLGYLEEAMNHGRISARALEIVGGAARKINSIKYEALLSLVQTYFEGDSTFGSFIIRTRIPHAIFAFSKSKKNDESCNF